MKVYEIIHTKQMFEKEVRSQYSVIYEEAACRDISYVNHSLVESEEKLKKKLYIYKGNGTSSLQRVKEYPVFEEYLLEEFRKTIMDTYPEVFI
jgi:hypothetical protein